MHTLVCTRSHSILSCYPLLLYRNTKTYELQTRVFIDGESAQFTSTEGKLGNIPMTLEMKPNADYNQDLQLMSIMTTLGLMQHCKPLAIQSQAVQ